MPQESLLSTAYQFIQQGETQTAERLLTGLIRQEPRSEAAWLLMAACKNLPEEKEKCLEFVAEINPHNAAALQALGVVLAGDDAEELILQAFEDWQTREEEAKLKPEPEPEPTTVIEELPVPKKETQPKTKIKPIRTIWMWLTIVLLAVGQALAWLRIWQLETALAAAQNALVSAQVNIQSLQRILTEYIVEVELLRELIH